MSLRCRGLAVRYGETVALDKVSFDLSAGGRLAVVGPSGCGKSTLLRTIAGLAGAGSGMVEWDGVDVTAQPTYERGFGLMFQDHALFPHRDVAANVAFGLRMQRWSPTAAEDRVTELLDLVGLADRHHSRIDELSGGERQRVALARTLAPRPSLVMLDEPLASLDRVLRTELLDEMAALFDRLGVTVISVTHDLDEAFRLADQLAVMSRGRIERIGSAAEVWADPGTEFTARFLGYTPVGEAEALPGLLSAPWGTVHGALDTSVAGTITVAVAPGGFTPDPLGTITGVVVRSSFERGVWRHVVRLPDTSEVVVEVGQRQEGDITLSIDKDAFRVVQPTSSAV